MQIIIHRGTHQIGGCATEIRSGGTRILIDFGEELNGGSELKINGVTDGTADCDGVLFTHYHGDHIGLVDTVLPQIKLYAGEASKQIMITLNNKTKQYDRQRLESIDTFTAGRSFYIGEIKITPFSVDHSAYDSYMFLIEAEGKKILHTGDFRSHGFRGKGLKSVIEKYVKHIDVLICEGTTVKGGHDTVMTEYDLHVAAKKYLTENKYVFVICSSTNFDRIAAFCNAVPRGIYRVCDKYQLDMLEIVREYSRKYTDLYAFEKMCYYTDALYDKMRKRGFCMFVRLGNPYHHKIMESFSDLDPKVVYSMWSGYLKESENAEFISGFSVDKLHTSGHADIETIKTVISETSPKIIIPIHTEAPDEFANLAENSQVIFCNDGEIVEI